MTKYYNANIPTEINFVYGGRQYGKTYYKFKKLKEEYNKLKENNFELFKSYERLVNRIAKAIEYMEEIANNKDAGNYELFKDYIEYQKLLKILKGEE